MLIYSSDLSVHCTSTLLQKKKKKRKLVYANAAVFRQQTSSTADSNVTTGNSLLQTHPPKIITRVEIYTHARGCVHVCKAAVMRVRVRFVRGND